MATMTADEKEKACRAKARFEAGDVVITKFPVPVYNGRGKREGSADPPWEWLIDLVCVKWTEAGTCVLRYKVVAKKAPLYYHTELTNNQIYKKV